MDVWMACSRFFRSVVLEWITKQRKGWKKSKRTEPRHIQTKSNKIKRFKFDYQYTIAKDRVKNLDHVYLYFLHINLGKLDFHYLIIELFTRNKRLRPDTRLISIDRTYRTFQNAGNDLVILDAQPHQREDAQTGIQRLILFRPDLVLRSQQRVEGGDKIGK